MSIRAQDVVPISEARARLTELAEDVVAGAEKVLTKNGAAFVAIVDAKKLDYYHELEPNVVFRTCLLAVSCLPRTFESRCRTGLRSVP